MAQHQRRLPKASSVSPLSSTLSLANILPLDDDESGSRRSGRSRQESVTSSHVSGSPARTRRRSSVTQRNTAEKKRERRKSALSTHSVASEPEQEKPPKLTEAQEREKEEEEADLSEGEYIVEDIRGCRRPWAKGFQILRAATDGLTEAQRTFSLPKLIEKNYQLEIKYKHYDPPEWQAAHNADGCNKALRDFFTGLGWLWEGEDDDDDDDDEEGEEEEEGSVEEAPPVSKQRRKRAPRTSADTTASSSANASSRRPSGRPSLTTSTTESSLSSLPSDPKATASPKPGRRASKQKKADPDPPSAEASSDDSEDVPMSKSAAPSKSTNPVVQPATRKLAERPTRKRRRTSSPPVGDGDKKAQTASKTATDESGSDHSSEDEGPIASSKAAKSRGRAIAAAAESEDEHPIVTSNAANRRGRASAAAQFEAEDQEEEEGSEEEEEEVVAPPSKRRKAPKTIAERAYEKEKRKMIRNDKRARLKRRALNPDGDDDDSDDDQPSKPLAKATAAAKPKVAPKAAPQVKSTVPKAVLGTNRVAPSVAETSVQAILQKAGFQQLPSFNVGKRPNVAPSTAVPPSSSTLSKAARPPAPTPPAHTATYTPGVVHDLLLNSPIFASFPDHFRSRSDVRLGALGYNFGPNQPGQSYEDAQDHFGEGFISDVDFSDLTYYVNGQLQPRTFAIWGPDVPGQERRQQEIWGAVDEALVLRTVMCGFLPSKNARVSEVSAKDARGPRPSVIFVHTDDLSTIWQCEYVRQSLTQQVGSLRVLEFGGGENKGLRSLWTYGGFYIFVTAAALLSAADCLDQIFCKMPLSDFAFDDGIGSDNDGKDVVIHPASVRLLKWAMLGRLPEQDDPPQDWNDAVFSRGLASLLKLRIATETQGLGIAPEIDGFDPTMPVAAGERITLPPLLDDQPGPRVIRSTGHRNPDEREETFYPDLLSITAQSLQDLDTITDVTHEQNAILATAQRLRECPTWSRQTFRIILVTPRGPIEGLSAMGTPQTWHAEAFRKRCQLLGVETMSSAKLRSEIVDSQWHYGGLKGAAALARAEKPLPPS